MSAEVAGILTALVAAIGSLLVAVYSLRKTRELAEADARRSYEYEARKRLYTECEPILFQAGELAEGARRRIESLARSAREGEIEPTGEGWLARRGYYFESTLFRLLVPHTAFRLLQRRLTVVDLALEPRIRAQYELLKLLYDSFTWDFDLAKQEPKRAYAPDRADPDVPRAAYRRERWPALFARQGFYRGTFERVVEALVTEPGEAGPSGSPYGSRAKTFGEFSRDLADETSELRTLLPHLDEVFGGFHPTRKPVLWRVLLAQDLLYTAFSSLSRDSTGGGPPSLAGSLPARNLPDDLAWRSDALADVTDAEMAEEYRAAHDEVTKELAKIDERLRLSRPPGPGEPAASR